MDIYRDAIVLMSSEEDLDYETLQQKRDLVKSSAYFYCSMRDMNVGEQTIEYFEQINPVDGHGYAHLFGWALIGE